MIQSKVDRPTYLNSYLKYVSCEIKSVSKIERKQIFPKPKIDPSNYFVGDKIC